MHEEAVDRSGRTGEQRREPAVVDDRFRADLVEQLRDLGRVVVVVDVEGDRTGAVRAEHRLDVLGAVRKEDGDGALPALPPCEILTLALHAEARRRAKYAPRRLRAFLHLGVGATDRRPHEHLAVGHGFGDRIDRGGERPLGRHARRVTKYLDVSAETTHP